MDWLAHWLFIDALSTTAVVESPMTRRVITYGELMNVVIVVVVVVVVVVVRFGYVASCSFKLG